MIKFDTKINKIEASVEKIEAIIAGKKAAIDELQNEIDSLYDTFSTLNDKISQTQLDFIEKHCTIKTKVVSKEVTDYEHSSRTCRCIITYVAEEPRVELYCKGILIAEESAMRQEPSIKIFSPRWKIVKKIKEIISE